MPDSDFPENGEPTQHFPAPGPGADGWVLGNRYRVTGRIGSGGMADVFRAHDELLDRDVAVKVFRSSTAGADTAAGAERQRAELHALARLNHPNLITLYDGSVAGPDDREARAYLVMELVEGPNLGNRIETGPLPSEPEARMIGAQIADALAYVHEQGMVHRDVKPANILLGAGTGTEHVRARLSDFGIVRLVGSERLTQADSTLGTASYLAPEQARGSAVGPPADIYALGLTLIEALTGVRSFDGATPLEAVVARLERDPEIPRNLPQPWPGLLTAMTARDPAARPTARQVADALRGGGIAAATTRYVPAAGMTGATTVLPPTGGMPPVRPVPVGEPEPPLPEPEPKPRNVGLIVGLILAGVLVLVAILIIVATSGGDNSNAPVAPTTSSSSTSSSSSSDDSSSSSSDEPSSSSRDQSSDDNTPTRTSATTSPDEQTTSDEPSKTPTTRTTEPTTTSPRTTPPTSSTSQTGTSDGGR